MTKDVTYSNPPSSGTPLGLYSQVSRVRAGELLFIAGQLAPGDFEAQFRGVFAAMGAILNDFGADFGAIAKFTTYLVDAKYIDPFMELRRQEFPKLFGNGAYPPNTLLIVDRLVKPEFLIEVEAVARLPG